MKTNHTPKELEAGLISGFTKVQDGEAVHCTATIHFEVSAIHHKDLAAELVRRWNAYAELLHFVRAYADGELVDRAAAAALITKATQ